MRHWKLRGLHDSRCQSDGFSLYWSHIPWRILAMHGLNLEALKIGVLFEVLALPSTSCMANRGKEGRASYQRVLKGLYGSALNNLNEEMILHARAFMSSKPDPCHATPTIDFAFPHHLVVLLACIKLSSEWPEQPRTLRTSPYLRSSFGVQSSSYFGLSFYG
ncbi:hypothetical protein VNO77_32333 [Canavalia gladiata]|uniref:Uncharacterized protein n=1 Tax=Canavalia gladiata TaxID=3824 RepID=A0AAN9Q513_CANGL